MMLLLILAACPKAMDYTPEGYAFDLPAGIYTTRPVPCPYDERMLLSAEAWTLSALVADLAAWPDQYGVDAAIDVTFAEELVTVPLRQCDDAEITCRENPMMDIRESWGQRKYPESAAIWRASGLGVDWLCGEGATEPNEG
jgi:hypothetical protein